MSIENPVQLTIFTDGGSRGNPGPAAYGVYVVNQDNEVVYKTGQVLGVATNNEAEYHGFLASLKWLQTYMIQHPVDSVAWKLDSTLVVKQLLREWKVKDPRMAELAGQCWQIFRDSPIRYTINYVPRELNFQADALVNAALDGAPIA